MIEIQKATVMRLPDGSKICVAAYDSTYLDGNEKNQNWMSVDISRVYPDNKEELLVSVDFDNTKGLRTLVFDDTQADPIFTKEDKL